MQVESIVFSQRIIVAADLISVAVPSTNTRALKTSAAAMSRIQVKFECKNFIGRDGRAVNPHCGFDAPKYQSTAEIKRKDFQRAKSNPKTRDQLVSSIIEKNTQAMIQQYDFLCCNCDGAATDFRVAHADCLDKSPPQILILIAYPVCTNQGCVLAAHQRMEGVMASLEKEDGVKGLQSKSRRDCCTCLKTATKILKCSRCKAAYYCSKQCQLKDWSVHKKFCKAPDASQTFAHCL